MLYEYALEPALLSNWTAFRYFTEKFNFSEGRLISRFPKRWKEEVHTLLSRCDVRECSEMQLKRVEALLFGEDLDGRTFDDRMLARQCEWNPEKDWLTNAEIEHGKRPFRAILAKENPHSKDFILEGDSVEDATPLFKIEGTPTIPRSARRMATLVAPVLHCAKKILLIDPHFRAKSEQKRFVKELLATAIHGRSPSFLLERIEIHAQYKVERRENQEGVEREKISFETDMRRLENSIPKDMKVQCVRWSDKYNPDERFHNRFILTDRGGLQFGDGLEQGKGKDQIHRVGKGSETYGYIRKLYTKGISPLDFIDEIEIVGEAMPSQQNQKRTR